MLGSLVVYVLNMLFQLFLLYFFGAIFNRLLSANGRIAILLLLIIWYEKVSYGEKKKQKTN